jgi:predicted phage tail protein
MAPGGVIQLVSPSPKTDTGKEVNGTDPEARALAALGDSGSGGLAS